MCEGSSPRMRGAPGSVLIAGGVVGIIPAYAGSTARSQSSTGFTWDHPRVCGEHSSSAFSFSKRLGSSPRMRGARPGHLAHDQGHGIIPAYAGSTDKPVSTGKNDGDHPRVCGEHPYLVKSPSPSLGSSPRMRGAHCVLVVQRERRGIIPAYAGSTLADTIRRSALGDHPRVCGEHFGGGAWWFVVLGSSPRMRGAQQDVAALRVAVGIIPAYAGSTGTSYRLPLCSGDHPRVCGEHSTIREAMRSGWGSSPRMRGALEGRELLVDVGGIIPAYAGSTATRPRASSPSRDHPRVCGEHLILALHRPCPLGSSPRMRGARVDVKRGGQRVGIIPAYAGSTRTVSGPTSTARDHPRVCGEHMAVYDELTIRSGSSPRMRGARCRQDIRP